MMLIYSMLTLSLDIIISGEGLLSFGHQIFFAIGGYTASLLAKELGVTFLPGILAALLFSGLAGFIIGLIILRKLRATYLAITTLALSQVLFPLFQSRIITKTMLHGVFGIVDIPFAEINIPFLPKIVFKSETSCYYLVLLILFVMIYLIVSWKRSRFGRAAVAIRENEKLAKSIGINSYIVLTMGFSLSTAMAGLTGAVYAYYVHAVNPHMFGTAYMLIMFICLYIGGAGTIVGPIVGAFIYTFAVKPLPISEPSKLIILGSILLTFILFIPQGVYPFLQSGIKNIFWKFRKYQDKL